MSYFKFNDHSVHYSVQGNGDPLLLLAGNTASSKMFKSVNKLYAKHFTVINIDFPGHGRSSRMETFETDFWFYNATVAKALLDHLAIGTATVVGTSGGALVGINLALEWPERVTRLYADSFEGARPLPSFIDNLKQDRERDKKHPLAKLFWYTNHGRDWRQVVDNDTAMNLAFAKTGRSFFHKSISELCVPTLLTASRKDEFCDHIEDIYLELKTQNPLLEIHMFDEGGHPAMLSNKKDFLDIVLNQA
jgi:pimeloyl-ACP methyl ester carboxylesterase